MKLHIAFLVVLSATTLANAAQLGIYTFTGAAGNEPTFPVDFQPADAVFSAMSRGPGITGSAATNAFSASGWSTNALDPDDYFEFSITPAFGFSVTLTNLTFAERRSSTGIRDISVRSSVDSFSADIATFNVPDDIQFRSHTVALGASFVGLTGTVTFRLYGYNAEAGTGTWRIDDVALFGSIDPVGPPMTNIQFTLSNDVISEAGGAYTVTVFKTLPSGNVSGSIVLGGTATSPADYTIDTTNFTLNGSVTSATFVVTIVDDGAIEPDETITLTLANVVGGNIASPSVFTLTITDNDAPPPVGYPTNVITYQRFEAGDPWVILDGAANISSADGAADFPPNQRIQQGINSWQVNAGSVTLDLAQVSISGFTNRMIKARVSSTSISSANGADVGDFVRFFVAIDSDTFPATFALSLNGFNNARWGFWATNIVDVFATSSNTVTAPQGGLNSNNYSTIYIRIPDSATSVALRVWAFNDNANEVWNVDNIEVLGDSGSFSPFSPAQTSYILAYWGSIGAYTGDTADDDGDGFSNLEEFIAGTIPVPPSGNADYPRSIAITNALNRFVVTPSVTGRLYRLWATSQLLGTQAWSQVAGPVPGTGSNLSLTDGVTTNFRVYRLTVELENP